MIIKQIRYYDEGYEGDLNKKSKKELNQPLDITAEKLVSGEYFKEIKCGEIQIKTYPGTKLTINGESIYIGETGIYNILYRENTIISSIQVDADSIEYIKNDPREYFVITFIQKEEKNLDEEINSDIDDGENNGQQQEDGEEPSDGETPKTETRHTHDK